MISEERGIVASDESHLTFTLDVGIGALYGG
jgi:hypothetical protein